MTDYSNGKIYKIVCNITGEIYVGSTVQTLAQRLTQHRCICPNSSCSKQIIERGDYYIVLLESVACNNRDELRMKEREWFDKLDCINIKKPFTPLIEAIENNAKNRVIYNAKNRDVILKKAREYHSKNKDVANEKHREWCAKNKVEISEYGKTYREVHREELYEKNKKYIADNPDKQREFLDRRKVVYEMKKLAGIPNKTPEQRERINARRRENRASNKLTNAIIDTEGI